MKNKKLFLPAIILVVAIVATAVYLLVSSIAIKPTVTEAEFPFSITYELDGETITIDEVYKARYVPNDDKCKGRVYVGEIGNLGEGNTVYTLKQNENTRVELWTALYPDYMMGDTEYDYFDDRAFEPRIYYYDAEEIEYHDEETLAAQGVKLIGFEYPAPIENSFVFSHLAYFTGEVVLPAFFIALLALLVTIIFVRKEKGLKYKAVDIVSIVFNFIVGTGYLWFVTVLAILIDIEGGGPELYYQVMYFIPSISVLGITASIALRRKGYRKSSLAAGFIGPIIFVLYLLIFYVGGLL